MIDFGEKYDFVVLLGNVEYFNIDFHLYKHIFVVHVIFYSVMKWFDS